MTWVAFMMLAALAVAPVLLTLRRAGAGRLRQATAASLYRAQLAELDRDLADGRIAAVEHAAAALEVQRRLLAAAEIADPPTPPYGRREPVALAVAMVVAVAFGLYAIDGRPELPARTEDTAKLAASTDSAAEQAQLQRMINDVDAVADATRHDQIEQGDGAERRGDFKIAAMIWNQALAIRFDPVLAVRTADVESRAQGRIGFHAAALFRRALSSVPGDTPWRALIVRRLSEAQPP